MNKQISAVFSKSGEALRKMSIFILVIGIIACIVLVIVAVEMGPSPEIIGKAFEVLFVSLFLFALGKAISSIANYAEAIYKKINPDAIYDHELENGARFFPGDKVHFAGETEECDVTVSKTYITESGYIRYECVKANGEKIEANNMMLKPIE